IYTTFLGGDGYDTADGVAIDGIGRCHVVGDTYSTDFPTTAGAPQSTSGGSDDGFVAVLASTGAALVSATYFGRSSIDSLIALAVDPTGGDFTAGCSTGNGIPITPGAYETTFPNGAYDCFIVRLSSDSLQLLPPAVALPIGGIQGFTAQGGSGAGYIFTLP